jgi:aminoglycoside phosphotransferase (APT) family kinase protein
VAPGIENLSPEQRTLLDQWLPGAIVERDHSWGLVATTVLELTRAGTRFIVKAAGSDDHHIAREIHAHHHWLEPWTTIGRAPRMEHCDARAKLLVTRHQPGTLVLDTAHEGDPAAYRQAGELLALLHTQLSERDDGYEATENAKSLAWLDKPHRIAPEVEARLRAEIATWPSPPAVLVPTHGDWQARNWLVHDGVVSVIDFGRAALRPAMSDFARLAAKEFRRDPALEAAFLEGYGSDPREPAAWHRNEVREAVGTAVWAHQVGDEPFEQHGHRMIAHTLAVTGGLG